MARFTFGGRIEQLIVQPDASNANALKAAPGTAIPALYAVPLGTLPRPIETDFMLDPNNDGVFDTATSTLIADAQGYAPYFQARDNVSVLYDAYGHALFPHPGSSAGTVSAASETVAGIAEIASNAESDAGTSNTTIMSPAKVARAFDAHEADITSHPDMRQTILDNAAAIAGKISRDVTTGLVSMDDLPAAEGPTPNTLAVHDATGAVQGANATLDTHLVPKLQMFAEIAAKSGGGADVRSLDATGLPLSSTSTTFATIGGASMTDAQSGWWVDCYYLIIYRGLAAAGIKVQPKIAVSAVTNLLSNPSFETNTTNWNPSGAHTITRGTAVAAQDGSAYGIITAANTTTIQVFSEWIPCTPGQIFSAGAYFKLGVGTAKVARADVQYGDAAVPPTIVRSYNGTNVTPGTGTWTRSLATGDTTGAPATATQVRTRVTYVSPAAADTVFVDAVQLEPTAALPAYGSTGGSGTNALDITGGWEGIKSTGSTVDDYGHVDVIRYIAGTGNLTGSFAAAGTGTDARVEGSFRVKVGGTGLTNQRIELEWAQRVTNATATQILAIDAVLARVK